MLVGDRELIDWVGEAGEVMAQAAIQSGPDAPIPTCAGWTMADLLGHVAPYFTGWYRYNLTHAPGEGDMAAAIASATEMPQGHLARVGYLRDACTGFTARAEAVDLDAPVWAFWMTRPARFWLLRAATELAVHAWDAECAVGTPTPIGAERAATGVEETLAGMWPGLVELGRRGVILDAVPDLPGEPVGIVATDSAQSWVIDHADGQIQVTEGGDLPPTVVSASGHDLMMYQWGREPTVGVSVVGDENLAAAWNLYCASSVAEQQAANKDR